MIKHIFFTFLFFVTLLSAYIEAGWISVRVQINFVARCVDGDRVGSQFNVSLWERDAGKRGVLFFLDKDDLITTVTCTIGEPCTIQGQHDEEFSEFYLEFNAVACYKKDFPVVRVCSDYPLHANGRMDVVKIEDDIVLFPNRTTKHNVVTHDCTAYD